jgi:hypothetical protein
MSNYNDSSEIKPIARDREVVDGGRDVGAGVAPSAEPAAYPAVLDIERREASAREVDREWLDGVSHPTFSPESAVQQHRH